MARSLRICIFVAETAEEIVLHCGIEELFFVMFRFLTRGNFYRSSRSRRTKKDWYFCARNWLVVDCQSFMQPVAPESHSTYPHHLQNYRNTYKIVIERVPTSPAVWYRNLCVGSAMCLPPGCTPPSSANHPRCAASLRCKCPPPHMHVGTANKDVLLITISHDVEIRYRCK